MSVRISNFSCKGKLSNCLNSINDRTSINFNYRNELIDKSKLKLPKRDYLLRDILEEINKQCNIQYSIAGESAINLYPVKRYFAFGSIIESHSRERIANVAVIIDNQNIVFTDKNGMFRFYSKDSVVKISAEHSSFQTNVSTINIVVNSQIIISLSSIEKLDEIEIINHDSSKLSLKSFDEIQPAKAPLPTLAGEVDAFNNLKLLPGIQNVSFGKGGLTIRGGSPDQNYTLLDGIPVYNTFHLLGLYSIFNSSTINSIKVHKDAFPSKYSNRLSSVIDVSLNNGNKNKTEINADIGILSSGISINGPIIKEKLSYSFSARRTYADILTLPFQRYKNRNKAKKNSTALWSYDIFGKIHYQINKNNQVSITAYNGGDQLKFSSKLHLDDELSTTETSEGRIGWRNNLAGMKWQSVINSRLFITTEASVSNYTSKFSDEYQLRQDNLDRSNSSGYNNGLQEVRISSDLDIVWSKNNLLKVGLGSVWYTFFPFQRKYTNRNALINIDTSLISRQLEAKESYLYLENKTYFVGGNITYGLRIAQFITSNKKYTRFQPKVLLIQNISKKNQLRFSISVANQFIHLVPNNNLGLPIDIWLPVTTNLKPLSSTQLSSKFITKHNKWQLEGSVFSKFYSNILEHQTGTQLLTDKNWEQNLSIGSGRSFGVETAARISYKTFSIYGAYTYCRTKRSVEDINNGAEYFSQFDRPHSLSLLGEYKVTSNDKIVFSFIYASGNPITIPTARYISLINGKEVIVEEFEDIYNFRLPSTHHLDISYIRKRTHKNFNSSLIIGVYNVYNRLNPFMVFIGVNKEAKPVLKLRSYLPIMPMLKYSIQW